MIVVAEAGVDSLAALAHRKHWRAESGAPARAAIAMAERPTIW